MKSDGHLGRCYLKGRHGDATNVVLSAVGHNLRIVLDWLRMLLRLILIALWRLLPVQRAIKSAS
jgi:IS5 family transposase